MAVFEDFIQELKQYDSLEAIQSRFQDTNGIINELGTITVLCSKKIIDPDPDNFIRYAPDDATVVGLFVKLHKGLEILFCAHNSGTLDAVWPLIRINFEAYIKMRYLIREGKDAQKLYRLTSYKNRYKMYQKYNDGGNDITDVFLYKFLNDINDDGFTIRDFEDNTLWKAFEGKSFEELMKMFEPAENYLSGYALESDSIHSDWGDIRQLHLQPINGGFVVKIEPEKYHGRAILAFIYLHLQATESFLAWYKNDFGVEIVFAEELITELKRVSKILMLHFINIYKNSPDYFVQN